MDGGRRGGARGNGDAGVRPLCERVIAHCGLVVRNISLSLCILQSLLQTVNTHSPYASRMPPQSREGVKIIANK